MSTDDTRATVVDPDLDLSVEDEYDDVTDPDNSRPSVLRGLVEVSSDGLTPHPANVR